jgi:cephalosporin hydroxylase
MDWQSYGNAYQWVADQLAKTFKITECALPALSAASYAGLYRFYNLIPGQSDNTKLMALTELFRMAPSGDVIEIGALYGKSAFALTWLAKFHHIGTVICVDPWELASIKDQGTQANILNTAVSNRDWNQVFHGFTANLSVFDNVNYLRAPSVLAAEAYQQAMKIGSIHTEEFDRTPISGKIAILHIDGNHKYEVVKRDIEKWLPFVQEGGWVLLDDYVWAFGDGPKRAGDEFLIENKRKIDVSFVMGDTLFIQLSRSE